MPDTILLIHGLWMTPRSWEHWIGHLTEDGRSVLAPAWPGLDVEVEALREDPAPLLDLGVTEVVDHYDRIVRGLDSPPILMGHSFGGAVVQLLLDRGLGAAGVAIDSVAVRGVLRLPLSTLKANFPILSNPANRKKAISLSPEQFHASFANTLTEDESAKAYERYQVPGAARMLFQAASANANPKSPMKVDFDNDERPPLLFIAGGSDHLVPPSVNKANAKKYAKHLTPTKQAVAFKEFAGRSHFIVGEPGWEEVADYARSWAERPVRTGV